MNNDNMKGLTTQRISERAIMNMIKYGFIKLPTGSTTKQNLKDFSTARSCSGSES